MKEPVVVSPKFQSFSSHIFSQASENARLKVRVDRSVRKNNLTMNNPLHVEKEQWACFLLNSAAAAPFLCSWWLWVLPMRRLFLCFWIINVKPNFVTRFVPRDTSKIWVLISLLSYFKIQVYAPLLLSFLQSLGRNFAAMRRMLKISVKISWQTP
jgi:hypothetical protein